MASHAQPGPSELAARRGQRVHVLPVRNTWLQRALGVARCGAWGGTLWWVHAPWRRLGGLVGERTRWAERWVLGMGLILGMAAGNHARLASRPGRGLDHAWFVRRVHLPLAAAMAVALATLQLAGRGEWVLVVFNGWLAFCAGFDFEIAARPLVEGREYRFRGPVADPDDEADDDAERSANDDPSGWLNG